MNRIDVAALKRCGFSIISTGGGCEAWYAPLNNEGAHVLITAHDDPSPDVSNGYAIGVYEGQADGAVAYAVAEAETLDDVLKMLADNGGAILHWQVADDMAVKFLRALSKGLIRFDCETDCFAHPQAQRDDEGGYSMPQAK
jgi:hypothetical protein